MQIIDGNMKDIPIQDPKSSCYQKAKAFTDNYELISKYYPIFKVLKGCMLAIAVAKAIQKKTKNIDVESKKLL